MTSKLTHAEQIAELSIRQVQLDEKTLERFLAKVRKEDGHWIWTSALTAGYPQFLLGRGNILAHRLSYNIYKGVIPKGMNVRATCGRSDCINPEHLELESQSERTKRMWANRAKRLATAKATA